MTPPHPKKSSPLSSPKSSIDSDPPDLDDPSIQEKSVRVKGTTLFFKSEYKPRREYF